MPQLIAMVLVVVGALVYMFQTFGGTGNNIEGMAQKTSVITEINNIKNGLQVALASKDMKYKSTTSTVEGEEQTTIEKTDLKKLADKEYFTTQINDLIKKRATDSGLTDYNIYDTISFGSDGSMTVELVINDRDTQVGTIDASGKLTAGGIANIGTTGAVAQSVDWVPGINVKIAKDPATALSQNASFIESQIAKDLEPIAWVDRKGSAADADASDTDGDFTIYFKDLPKDKIRTK